MMLVWSFLRCLDISDGWGHNHTPYTVGHKQPAHRKTKGDHCSKVNPEKAFWTAWAGNCATHCTSMYYYMHYYGLLRRLLWISTMDYPTVLYLYYCRLLIWIILWTTLYYCEILWVRVTTVKYCGLFWTTVDYCGRLWTTVDYNTIY